MGSIFRKAWQRGRSILPVEGFSFDRPLVCMQSDDWGRVGVQNREVWEEVRGFTPNLGERAYDFYSLETADDVAAIASLLGRHRDSIGRPACLEMNFLIANVDFTRVMNDDFRQIHLRPLSEGLPDGWERPGLFDEYRKGIKAGLFVPSLHGTTHFCRSAVEPHMNDSGERGALLRGLWGAGVPYIHWRMPWVGFEYWRPSDHGEPDRFVDADVQENLISSAAKTFTEFFSVPPLSACAPGYRANAATHRAWSKSGIRVVQNGPGSVAAPHLDSHEILHLYRTVDFEPATDETISVDGCLRRASDCFERGLPVVVSMHSINFHSTIRDFRTRTLNLLDEFLSALELQYPELLYVSDKDLYDLVQEGKFQSAHSTVKVQVSKRIFRGGSAMARTGT
jgi:hypothetical protein